LGTLNPIQDIIQSCRKKGVLVLIDGAQSVGHQPVDVQALDCDFYCFSGHKMYGPTGIGVLYGKYDVLKDLPPYQTGGSMIKTVSFEETVFADLPHRFEPGTPAIAEIIGLGEALDWISSIGFAHIQHHESLLLSYTREALDTISDLNVLSRPKTQEGIISFMFSQVHAHDVGTFLDELGIAVRVGHHCAQPLMKKLDVRATVRVSFGLYNSLEDCQTLIQSLHALTEYFK
jgi:cysteine desulfurase/selenocysteine lyase